MTSQVDFTLSNRIANVTSFDIMDEYMDVFFWLSQILDFHIYVSRMCNLKKFVFD